MADHSTSSERNATDLIRFGLGFVGFIMGVAGLVLVSPTLAVSGGLLLLLIVWSFSFADD